LIFDACAFFLICFLFLGDSKSTGTGLTQLDSTSVSETDYLSFGLRLDRVLVRLWTFMEEIMKKILDLKILR
jgi:hypothetical protein